MEENLKPIEENGFIIADFTSDNITPVLPVQLSQAGS